MSEQYRSGDHSALPDCEQMQRLSSVSICLPCMSMQLRMLSSMAECSTHELSLASG